MANQKRSVCKLCRREGVKLFLKGTRCETSKCALNQRNYQPGVHPWVRARHSEYRVQLREKQKLKRFYGVAEKQFSLYFEEAVRMKGNTGENLLVLLERRLDNVVYSLGMADSRSQARQMVAHGPIALNGRKMDIPSYLVKVGDVISAKSHKKSEGLVRARLEERTGHTVPSWLTLDAAQFTGTVSQMPSREDVVLPIQEAYIVEFCSR